jgi:hypothetical protein
MVMTTRMSKVINKKSPFSFIFFTVKTYVILSNIRIYFL